MPTLSKPIVRPLLALSMISSALMAGCATTSNPASTSAAAPSQAATASTTASTTAPGAGAASQRPVGASATPPTTGPASAGAPSAAAAPQPGQPPAFATVIKDAKRSEGLFGVWQREDKIWLELKPEDFNTPFFFAPKLASGIGEADIYGGKVFGRWGLLGRSYLVEFRRVHNQVRLVALNTEFTAQRGGPEARAVQAAFSPSLLSSTSVASQAHPERKTVLVDATPLFMSDILGLGFALQQNYRQGYSLDPRHTTIQKVRNDPTHVVFDVQAHFATGGISVPASGAPTPPGAPTPSTPRTLPDVRSMFIGIHYSLSKLPQTPMASRKADPRVGYFASTTQDFSDDLSRTPKQRVINRWRLDKKDPSAAMSEPVKPITFWLDRTIPLKYRAAITKGIEAWNPAFEKIGYKGAIVAKVQPDDAPWDTLDVGYASVRWITNANIRFGAIGPSQVDPRTGEILDADISFESLNSRSVRAIRSQLLAAPDARDWRQLMQLPPQSAEEMAAHRHDGNCTHAANVFEQLGYALDVLEARGELDPDGPEVEKFVQDALTDVTMHEVGHTLGLRHNFRSSKIYSEQQLNDAEFTGKNGLAGSVMEYTPINLPSPGQKGGVPWQTVLGPYDHWAIEYGYKPIPREQEAAELQRIASRSGEPLLAYATDEDNILGIDPDAVVFDLGNDPVAFAKKRIAIADDIIRRQESRSLRDDADFSVLSRSISYALRDMGRASGVLVRQIGGLRTLRDFPNTRRDPLQPVEPQVQREALNVLAKGIFSVDAVQLSPALQRRLAPDFDDRGEALFSDGVGGLATNYSVVPSLIEMRRQLLGQLMSDAVASRIIDNVGRSESGTRPLQLSELYARLTDEVWSEVRQPRAGVRGDIAPLRRELQREFVNRLSLQLLRPSSSSRADTRSLMRTEAQRLLTRIQAAQRVTTSAQTRAHLNDSADSLMQALSARLQRQGV